MLTAYWHAFPAYKQQAFATVVSPKLVQNWIDVRLAWGHPSFLSGPLCHGGQAGKIHKLMTSWDASHGEECDTVQPDSLHYCYET